MTELNRVFWVEHTCGRTVAFVDEVVRCVNDCEVGLAPPCGSTDG